MHRIVSCLFGGQIVLIGVLSSCSSRVLLSQCSSDDTVSVGAAGATVSRMVVMPAACTGSAMHLMTLNLSHVKRDLSHIYTLRPWVSKADHPRTITHGIAPPLSTIAKICQMATTLKASQNGAYSHCHGTHLNLHMMARNGVLTIQATLNY